MALPAEWKQFPYAHQYLDKYLRSEEESKLLSRWITRFSYGMELKSTIAVPSYSRYGAHRPDGYNYWHIHTTPIPYDVGIPETLYWEAAASFQSLKFGWVDEVNLGLEWESYVCYYSDGRIAMGEACTMIGYEGYISGDIIGCGFTDFGNSVFFTKNGCHIATVIPPNRDRTLTWMRLRTTNWMNKPVLNFGQKAFQFDLENHLQKIAQSHELASTLPSELVRDIVELILGKSISGIQEYRNLHHISRVSRYYCELCSTMSFRQAVLSTHTEMKAAIGLGVLSRTRNVILREHPMKPWLHLFQLPPSSTAPPQRWTCNFADFKPRCPSHSPINIRPLIGIHSWTGIRELLISHRTFKTWANFAALVFSFPHLETLKVDEVRYEDAASVEISPRWLRFSRRLRKLFVWINGNEDHQVGFFRLFITGKQTSHEGVRDLALSGDDIPIMARIMRALSFVTPWFVYIAHKSLDNGTHTLATYRYRGKDDSCPITEVTLQPHAEQYQVVKIRVETDYKSHHGRLPNHILHHLLLCLSSHNTLRLEIVPDIRDADPDEIHRYWAQQFPTLYATGRLKITEAPSVDEWPPSWSSSDSESDIGPPKRRIHSPEDEVNI